MSQLLYAATEGVGVVQLPDIVADDAIASGAIANLLPDWTPAAGTVQAIFASRRGLLPSVRSLIDFLAVEFGRKVGWDDPNGVSPGK
jgi:DNA-binding transcriptional LysR family regulator